MAIKNIFKRSKGLDDKVVHDNNNFANSWGLDNLSNRTALSKQSVMKLSALYNGVQLIVNSIASMPIYLYSTEDDIKIKIEDFRCFILSNNANEYLSAFNLKQKMLQDLIYFGNGYCELLRDNRFNITGLKYHSYFDVTIIETTNGFKYRDILGNEIEYYNMLTLVNNISDDCIIKGTGILEIGSDTLGLNKAQQDYLYDMFKKGMSLKGVLKVNTNANMDDDKKNDLKQSIKKFFIGGDDVLVLTSDYSFTPTTISPIDSKVEESKEASVRDVARLLCMNPTLLGCSGGSYTYTNLTNNNADFLTRTLSPYIIIMEQACNNVMLTQKEKVKGWHYQVNSEKLLNSDPNGFADYLIKLKGSDILTKEECRKKLNYGTVEEVITDEITN